MEILEIIKATPKYIIIILSLYFPSKILNIPDIANRTIDVISSVFIIFWLINICDKVTVFLIKRFFKDK